MAVSQSNREGLRQALHEWSDCAYVSLLFEGSEEANGWVASVSQWLVDASLLGDTQNLSEGLESLKSIIFAQLQNKYAEGVISALAEVAQAALDRARQAELVETLWNEPSRISRLLMVLYETPSDMSETQIEARLGEVWIRLSSEPIKTTLGILVDRGLVTSQLRGNELRWRITPLGVHVAEKLLEKGALPA